MSGVQTSVNVYYPLGIPGDIAFYGPMRAAPYNLVSSPTPNYVGYAYTVTSGGSPDTVSGAPLAGTAAVGGSGVFAGILTNRHIYQQPGTTAGALASTLAVPDNTIGELLTMGQICVNLPGPASVGDLVTYDALTGALNSIVPTSIFTGAISTTTLTVSAVSQGQIGVGKLITGANVTPGTRITALGTGLGGTGTYTVSVSQTAASATITQENVPATAWAASSAYITTSTGVDTLHITTLTSGELQIGQAVFGTGVAPNTVITAFGSGVGGTGTYTLNTSGQVVASSGSPIAMTGPANTLLPNATVYRYNADTTGGNAIIQLTN